MIYLGAGLGKLNTRPWQQGTALSWCWYDEGIGRFYPNFVIELLYNRMLPIQIQTYLSLVIEVLCVVTIWPMKTRKITFIAIVFLHIGIELCLLMHIFEYLSVLGWVCFFVYPNDNDGNTSKPESTTTSTSMLVEKEKSEKGKGTSSAVSSSSSLYGPKRSKKIIIDTVVAVSLLYLLIFNIFPFQQVTLLIPTFFSKLLYTIIHPPRFMGHRLTVLSQTIGIHTGPYILFAGKPPHSQARLTAVIRFNDGTDPILYQDAEWAVSSYLQREIDYWLDAYLYYLYRGDGFDRGRIPYYATLAVHMAERYSNNKIHREYSKIAIDFDNAVESVSLQVHKRTGSERPPSPELGHFESIPREWTYESHCSYVFFPNDADESHSDHQQHYMNIKSDRLRLQNGCVNYNPADEVLHRKGKYGEEEEVGGGGDSTAVEENNNRYQVQHYQPQLRHQQHQHQQQNRQYPPLLQQQQQQQQQQQLHQQPQQQQRQRRRNEWQKQ